MNNSAQMLELIRKRYREDPNVGMNLIKEFARQREMPESEFYAPYASGKSNYTELTDYFQVDRFDDDFFRQGAALLPYLRYGASGTPLAPTKRSSSEEIAAYQFYRVQKADEPTRLLEDQWRALQKELSDKVSFGMDDDAIVKSIDWTKYSALKAYEADVKIRNVPRLTRPVAFSEDSVYGVLGAVRKGDKVGQTDRDYLPELVDYYAAQAQMNTQTNTLQQPGTTGPVSDAQNESPVQTLTSSFNTPATLVDTLTTSPALTKQQEQSEFNDLQYKLNQGYDLSPEQYNRWMDLYPPYSHGKPGARIPSGLTLSSSGGGAPSIEDQNNAWFDKYTSLINGGYAADYEHRMPSVEQLADYRNMASSMNMTVEQFFTEQYGGKPEWLEKIDYGEKRKTNPELITRLRPIEEVLPDYRAGKEISEAEREMLWQYDKEHPGLLGGTRQIPFGVHTLTTDERLNLGMTAYNALVAADNMTAEESNALILSIGQDMDASFGRYATLEDYYAANPERAADLQAFVDVKNARTEQAATVKAAQDAENARQAQRYAMTTFSAYSKGETLDANQQLFVKEIQALPVTDADKDDAYKQLFSLTESEIDKTNFGTSSYSQSAAEAYGNANNPFAAMATTHSVSELTVKREIKNLVRGVIDTDTRLAKSAGMTLAQYYEMFPEMKKTPTEIMNMAKNAYDEKWADRGGIFEFLFGVNSNELAGEGVSVGTALGKGAESGINQFVQGPMGFVRNYFTETDEATVQAWNRAHYGGPMGRSRARKEFTRAIEGITDPERKAYFQNLLANVGDIYDLPFNFSDEAVLNGLYENKKALEMIDAFMLSSGTPAEYAAFMVTSSLVDNGLSMATTAATTALTGNPLVGTMVGFGPKTAYQANEIGRAAGLGKTERNVIGLVAMTLTGLSEAIPYTAYAKSGTFIRGSLNSIKAKVMNGGSSVAQKYLMQIALGGADVGSKILENSAVEMTQETFENILNDAWLNLTGAQNKSSVDIFNDATRAGVMAAITAPFMTGQGVLLSGGKKIAITDIMRVWACDFVESKAAEAMKNPDAVGQVINAQAASDTIETLVNGGLADVDTSVVEQTTQDLKKAEADLAAAKEMHISARLKYADKMHKCTELCKAMSDEEHNVLLQTLVNAKNAYQSAIKTFSALSKKLKLDQGGLNRLLSGIIAKARAEAKVNAQAAILSEAAALRMEANMQKADEITEATVIVEQPLPENVSNEGDHLAQGNENDIMEVGALGELENAENPGGPAASVGKIVKFSDMTYDDALTVAKDYAKRAHIYIPDTAAMKPRTMYNGYEQITYLWREDGYKYEVRWHSRTPNAPIEQGNTWVIMRELPGNGSQDPQTYFKIGNTGIDTDWVPGFIWFEAIKARKAGTATAEQIKLLDMGHWKER